MYYSTATAITALLALTACSTVLPAASSTPVQLPQSACGLHLGQSTEGLQDLENFLYIQENGGEGTTFITGQFSCEDSTSMAVVSLSVEHQDGTSENNDTIRQITVEGEGYEIVPGLFLGASLAEIMRILPQGEFVCATSHVPIHYYSIENIVIMFERDGFESEIMEQSCDVIPDTIESTEFNMHNY